MMSWSGPNRKVSFGIFEICWGLAVNRETYASSSTGYFDRNKETWIWLTWKEQE